MSTRGPQRAMGYGPPAVAPAQVEEAWSRLKPWVERPSEVYCRHCGASHDSMVAVRSVGRTGLPVLRCPRFGYVLWSVHPCSMW